MKSDLRLSKNFVINFHLVTKYIAVHVRSAGQQLVYALYDLLINQNNYCTNLAYNLKQPRLEPVTSGYQYAQWVSLNIL